MSIVAQIIGQTPHWHEIEQQYRDPRRDYHGITHLEHQVELIDRCVRMLPDDEQRYAATFLLNCSLFHDCYYTYGMPSGFCEEVSAHRAKNVMTRNLVNVRVDSVFNTILATAQFTSKTVQEVFLADLPEKDRLLGLLFLDIDLDTFQCGKESKIDHSIVREAVNFGRDIDEVVQGRTKFLQLMEPRIRSGFYHHPYHHLTSFFSNDKVIQAQFPTVI